jgi:hypothetical protein
MSEEKYLSMDELASAAGIAYDRLLSFLRKNGSRIPSVKKGRNRFFPPRALEIVLEIARENVARQGRHLRRRSPEKAVSDEVMECLDRASAGLEDVKEELQRAYGLLLDNQFTVVLSLRTLAPGLAFRHPVDVLIEPAGRECVARLLEVGLCASGESRQEAMEYLRAVIVETYQELKRMDQECWSDELRQRAALLDMLKQTRQRKETP